MALTKLNNQSIAALTDFNLSTDDLPAGAVLQIATKKSGTNLSTTTTGTYHELSTGFRPEITKKGANSEIVVVIGANINGDLDNDGHGYMTGTVKVERYVNGSLSATMYDQGSIIDRAGQTRMRHTFVQFTDGAGTLGDVIQYRVYTRIDVNSNGRALHGGQGAEHICTMTEIAK